MCCCCCLPKAYQFCRSLSHCFDGMWARSWCLRSCSIVLHPGQSSLCSQRRWSGRCRSERRFSSEGVTGHRILISASVCTSRREGTKNKWSFAEEVRQMSGRKKTRQEAKWSSWDFPGRHKAIPAWQQKKKILWEKAGILFPIKCAIYDIVGASKKV